jgi:trehalose 6-phosphate synthase/phosphatase
MDWRGHVAITNRPFSSLGMARGSSFQGTLGAGVAAQGGLKPDITPVPEPAAKKVFAGEFSEEEKKEVEKELERFTIVESEHEGQARMKYVPVFVPPAMSKGHYEQFCKKSTCCCVTNIRRLLTDSSLASIPLPPLARHDRYRPRT